MVSYEFFRCRNGTAVIFHVPLPDGRVVWMSQVIVRGVWSTTTLIVKTRQFKSLLARGKFEVFLEQNADSLQLKYPYMEKQMARSMQKPVALPYIHHEIEREFVYSGRPWARKAKIVEFDKIDFSNGITRSTWLILNGCEEFPIQCNPAEVGRLQELAGCTPPQILTAAEIAELSILSPYASIGFPE